MEEELPGEGVVEGSRSCERSHPLQQTPAAKLERLQQQNCSASRSSRRCPGIEIGVGAGKIGVNLALESHGRGQVGQVHDLAIHVAAYPQVEDAYVRSDDSSLEIFASKPNMNDHIKEESIGVVGGNFNGKSISLMSKALVSWEASSNHETSEDFVMVSEFGLWWCGIRYGRV